MKDFLNNHILVCIQQKKEILYYICLLIRFLLIMNNIMTLTFLIILRKYQQRILGNGPELADKLSSILPNNYLIRLVDTASLPIIEQISIMRKTDYLIGVHGAGLSLSIFMPSHSVLHEILPKKNIKVLILMSALAGIKHIQIL